MTIRLQTNLFLALGILLSGVLTVQTQALEPAPDEPEVSNAEPLDLFDAIDEGVVEAKFIARSSTKGRLILTNKTKEEINVMVPEAFAGVHVLRQFGGGGGGGRGGGGGGRGGGGGGFNIAPEEVGRIDVPLVCLDHGLKDPSSNKPYEIRPLEDVVDSLALIEIVKAYAKGQLPYGASQAAVWNLNSEVSWIDLSSKLTGTKRNIVREPYFSSAEIRTAMAIVHRAQAMTEGETLERRNWTPPSASGSTPTKLAAEEYDGYDEEADGQK